MKKALVLSDKVIQVEETTFPVNSTMKWIDCPDNTEVGWDVEDLQVVVPPVPVVTLEQTKSTKLSELASYRYIKEVSGFTFNGQKISTDDRAKTLLMGARLEAMENPSSVLNWKTDSGFVVINAVAIIAISNAVRAFVQACFDREKAHSDAIQLLSTVEAVQSYNIETGWPS